MRGGVGHAGGGVSWLQQLTLTGVVYDILDVLEALVLVLLRLSKPFIGCSNVLVEHGPLLGFVCRAHLQSLDKGGVGEGQVEWGGAGKGGRGAGMEEKQCEREGQGWERVEEGGRGAVGMGRVERGVGGVLLFVAPN